MVQGRGFSRLRILGISGAALVLLSSGFACAQHERSDKTHEQTKGMLMPGVYTAKVKAIVCEGCGPMIRTTLQNFMEIEAVTVDQKSNTVQFSVKKDSMTTVSDLQKSLDAAAQRMGMGADYTLSEVKRK